ncbi:leucine--tRNA ligase [Pseudomonas agarici]|uniref:leucine--tRNA ligase n=1 Tax=Pseudomonas agarici TaxID=46677 RepID=UPI0002E59E53|nr:leucine--tRNA ligase [Pseudomonas agarici]NWB93593.1 leucine--tRNA ligase [Pseudomonas agarici]NWC11102.1 leucine--tRNA ligase [Pseudomonas agarici]SEL58621.1 leucyl-tRNA synthetase [Pseudomonas agarici]
MRQQYDPVWVESTVQAKWLRDEVFKAVEDESRPKFYACSMLPYPSGKLHMGHVRNYTINDMLARHLRMKGYNVLMPMGWDAFGLPAENAAMQSGVPPAEWTRMNIADMKSQMQPLGLAFDWSREIATCDPQYYKWNQWFFLRLLEKGLAYKKTQVVNWDPVDQTVLANEQVVDGRGWRSGALVEKREIPGYYLRITQYGEELLSAIDTLDGWPDMVRSMQRNWIGKTSGVRLAFLHGIEDAGGQLIDAGKLWVFTTRVETLMGVTFCAISPDHPLAKRAIELEPGLEPQVQVYRQSAQASPAAGAQAKLGIWSGLHVEHPLTGEPIAVWITNYVLGEYGEGALMGVPAHDERDFDFARQYGLPMRPVIAFKGAAHDPAAWSDSYASREGRLINSGAYDGLTVDMASVAIVDALAERGCGEHATTWRLRDWGISRQRYWGTPIPIIHCEHCGDVPVPYADLPVVLPTDCIPDGSGNPLEQHDAFRHVACPRCAAPALRETDTMDTFVDSSWYFMRYCDPDCHTSMVGPGSRYWMPIDQYIGGIEHAVLHLLYARFWTRAMRDEGLVDFSEPFKNLFTQGMLLRESYYRKAEDGSRRWFYPSEVSVNYDEKGRPVSATAFEDGLPVSLGGVEKMSKSKNNVVEPKDIINRFGADTARLFTIFAGPPDQSTIWSDSGVEGAYRFLRRLWSVAVDEQTRWDEGGDLETDTTQASRVRFEIHGLLQQINNDYERLQYNTVVSGAMKMLKVLEGARSAGRQVCRETLSILLQVLHPVTPHISQVLWEALAFPGAIHDSAWPTPDSEALKQDEVKMMVQVNGKLRGEILVQADADHDTIRGQALCDKVLSKYLEGAGRMIVVPNRLVNFIV